MNLHPGSLFADSLHRLSTCEAESFLKLYHCTLTPIAEEVAKFIQDNWPHEKIEALSHEARRILSDCLDEQGDTISPEPEG